MLLRMLGHRLERWLLRDEGRVLFRAQVQHPERALLRFNERWLARGLHIGPIPVLVRSLLRVLLHRLRRLPEQGLFRGKASPEPPGGQRTGRDEGKEEGGRRGRK